MKIIDILDKRKYKLLCSGICDSDIFKMFPFNSIELELLKRYCYNNRANIYRNVLSRIEESKAYLIIKRFGIFFNFEPNLFQIFKAIILKCYLFLIEDGE